MSLDRLRVSFAFGPHSVKFNTRADGKDAGALEHVYAELAAEAGASVEAHRLVETKAGRFFATQLGRYLAASGHFADVDLVVPVPLHWSRKWHRGYNQAQVIARELALALGAPLGADVLRRVRHTHTQTHLDADARLRNVAGVFQLRRVPEQARHILLVDDTFTTGATLATCYWALRSALDNGPRISVATLSAVQD